MISEDTNNEEQKPVHPAAEFKCHTCLVTTECPQFSMQTIVTAADTLGRIMKEEDPDIPAVEESMSRAVDLFAKGQLGYVIKFMKQNNVSVSTLMSHSEQITELPKATVVAAVFLHRATQGQINMDKFYTDIADDVMKDRDLDSCATVRIEDTHALLKKLLDDLMKAMIED